ncbi:hypothetical protein H012_gp129 [Acanthamoeba polyphaga moumouvirus]|uniref:Uncharacterized protein n=2 Tax=Moumouvirus TaxID=3080801 RepID=L7RDF3_9VIRU|nr:hypothetical protein H012_gp129 [Acanthamoeba polyphaga moumouvirus]AEX62319.1 hypothetical protein mv_L114 [Moumouvirus Monve]AGC02321.1 hypothetical protein Moumou_00803 [Acanthamoeba polyphaga moumouvirus]AQN68667.1 hypothetical protein [Saudi moumouvirus]
MKIKSILHIPENYEDCNPYSSSVGHNKKFRKIVQHMRDNFNYPAPLELEKKVKGYKYIIYEAGGESSHYNDNAMSLLDEYDVDLFDGEILGDVILHNNEKFHNYFKDLRKEIDKDFSWIEPYEKKKEQLLSRINIDEFI